MAQFPKPDLPVKNDRIQNLIRQILIEIGENPNRPGLIDTPTRVAKMYKEIFRGYDIEQKPKITVFPNGQDGIFCNSLIIDSSYFYSHCEHHMCTFFGQWFFGYVPKDKIIGASKIARIADYYSAKLQVQERLGIDVINCIEKAVKPLGSIIVMRGRHLCKEMRGVKKFNSPFETIEARGILLKNKDGIKDEFMSRISSINI